VLKLKEHLENLIYMYMIEQDISF